MKLIRSIIFTLLVFSISYYVSSQEVKSVLNQEVSDVMQMDEQNEFVDNGRYYCAPVAAANYLIWLSDNGFPDLNKFGETTKEKVLNLAKILGGDNYMRVTSIGISNSDFQKSVIAYVNDCGYRVKKTDCWDFNQYSFENIPDLDRITRGLDNRGMVWLMVGKYSYNQDLDIYVSKGLHFITLVGYGVNIHNDPQENCLIVNCSSPRSGIEHLNEYATLRKITSGKLKIDFPNVLNLEVNSSGFYEITDGLKWKRGDEVIIINGFVSIELIK